MSSTTAVRIVEAYAQSLLDLAVQSEIVDDVETDLELVEVLLRQEPAFGAFLASPYFAEQTKRDLVHRVFADRLNRITFNFLSVVIDHDRGALLPGMIDHYKQSYRTLRGYQTVTATVSRPLTEEQASRLTQDLSLAMDAKVDLDMRVDSSIIGGVILRYGDKMVDNSIRGRLVRAVGQVANPENRHKERIDRG